MSVAVCMIGSPLRLFIRSFESLAPCLFSAFGAAQVLVSFAIVVTERSLNNSSGVGTGRRTGHVGALTPLVQTPCRTLAVRINWQARKHSGMSCECERLATATV